MQLSHLKKQCAKMNLRPTTMKPVLRSVRLKATLPPILTRRDSILPAQTTLSKLSASVDSFHASDRGDKGCEKVWTKEFVKLIEEGSLVVFLSVVMVLSMEMSTTFCLLG
jgi:hypothetical protein